MMGGANHKLLAVCYYSRSSVGHGVRNCRLGIKQQLTDAAPSCTHHRVRRADGKKIGNYIKIFRIINTQFDTLTRQLGGTLAGTGSPRS